MPDNPVKKRRPSRGELLAAVANTVPDVIAPGLHVLFCGINPGLYTAYSGHHFAGPSNRFWPTLHAAGFTPRRLDSSEEHELLEYGYGVTNLVARATATAAELSNQELAEGARILEEKVRLYSPRCLAVLGIGAYRTGFGRPGARLGRQQERIGEAMIWVLPNPSGLNANYRPEDFARLFREMKETVDAEAAR